jgi:hypothetical protein
LQPLTAVRRRTLLQRRALFHDRNCCARTDT